jgi:hypothetical protein
LLRIRKILDNTFSVAAIEEPSMPQSATIPVTGGRTSKECKEGDTSLQLPVAGMTGILLNVGNRFAQAEFRPKD